MSILFEINLFVLIHTLCTFSVQVASHRSCRWNQLTISSTNGIDCRPCPECPHGQGVVPQCGSRVTTNVTVECVQCKPGESYSDKHDISSCKPCTICDPNEETISPCTATENAVCGECNAGFYRATTGDCKPCMRCCADSKDEDIEKQCKAQTNLPANQICRYDVNTINCAPTAYRTTEPAYLISTAPAIAPDKMAAHSVDGGSAITIWLIAVVACVAFTVCVLFGGMLFVCYRKQFSSHYLCYSRTHADGGTTISTPTQAVCLQPSSPPVVTGSDSPKCQMV